MQIDIIWNGETTKVDLADGIVRVGGSKNDHISIEGLPSGLVTLEVEGGRLKVRSNRSVRIGAALFPAHVPRLVLQGEEIKLPNDVVLRHVADAARCDSRKTIGTAFVAKELLGSGEVAPELTRAATITCVTGLDQGMTFAVAFSDSIIGRADDADIRIRDRAVSRKHASFGRKGKQFFIRPLSTTNGLFLNGSRVKAEREVKSGDVIELGQTLLRFDGPERAPEERTVVGTGAPPKQPAAPNPTVDVPPNAATVPLPQGEPTPVPVAAEPVAEWVAAEVVEPRRGISVELMMMGAGALLALIGAAVTIAMLS